MKVFVDTMFGSCFSFDLDPRSKVFDIKKSIETSQGIPISMQTLYFNDAELVVDHYQLRVYGVVNNSRLLLLLRAGHVNNQMLHQSPYAVQGFVPSMGRSNYDQVPPSHASDESFFNQDLSMMPRSSQVPPSSRLVSNEGQVLHQNVFPGRVPEMPLTTFGDKANIQYQSLGRSNKNQVPPSHASESFFNQYRLVSSKDGLFPEMPQDISLKQGFFHETTFGDLYLGEDFTNIRSHWPTSTREAIAKEKHMFQTDQSSTFGEFSFGNVQSNWHASTFDEIITKNQVLQPEHSPEQSTSTEESGNQEFQTEKSPPPQKLTLIITQYVKPGRKYLVNVNASDNVEELKKEMEYQLDLPANGYFLLHEERVFLHKERVLDDDKSFSTNLVADGDTIEIFPGPDIGDCHT